jgi:hypothetical protein
VQWLQSEISRLSSDRANASANDFGRNASTFRTTKVHLAVGCRRMRPPCSAQDHWFRGGGRVPAVTVVRGTLVTVGGVHRGTIALAAIGHMPRCGMCGIWL